MRRAVILTVTHILAIAAGVGFGAHLFSDRVAGPLESANRNFTATSFGDNVQPAPASGSDVAYEKALRDGVAFLDEALTKSKGSDDEFTHATEKAMALTRLAALAEKRDAKAEAIEFSRRAEAECPATRLRDCSAGSLRRLVEAEDNRQRPRPETKLRSEGR